jgi:hypothetical protein
MVVRMSWFDFRYDESKIISTDDVERSADWSLARLAKSLESLPVHPDVTAG